MAIRTPLVPLTLTALLVGCTGGGAERAQRDPGTTVAAAPAPAARPAADAQTCFAPLPGHPTPAERRAFVEEVGALAEAAEERHGVPAAAITAMAIQESGYGWTTLAQETNNLLAWKYTTPAAAGGRGDWVLDCGEVSDRYIVFADRSEAIDFVARQLATSDNYAADTERYRQDRVNGVEVAAAVDRWIDGIADPYSSNPEAYRTALRRVVNNPYAPSDQPSPEQSLYRLSEAAAPRRDA
jgi:hypothetical protein